MPHQKLAENFMFNNKCCGLFLDAGSGKTLTTLSFIYKMNLPYHVLVIAPKNVARSTWTDEINKWGFPLRTKSLIVDNEDKPLTRKKRLEAYNQTITDPPTMYFINKDLVVDLCKNLPKINNKPIWPFGIVVIDELQGFKSYKSERFKALKKQLPYIHRFIGLTGTPTPNGLMDLWPEIYLMDGGMRLGMNITAYRNMFFDAGLCVNGYPVNYNPKPGAENEIYRRVNDIVISVKNPNLNLPSITYNDCSVYMDKEELKIYKEFVKTQVLELGDDTIIAANAAILQNKLSQMASGAIYTDPDHNYAIIHKRKLEQCEYLIENTGSPVLIAYHFKSDKEMLLSYFPNAKLFDGTNSMIHAWNNREIPIMLVQPASAGAGLNLQQGGHTLIWYTLSWSLEEYIQMNARIYRKGQTEPVIIHHLLTDKTVDNKILAAINKKNLNEQALLDSVSATIKELEE